MGKISNILRGFNKHKSIIAMQDGSIAMLPLILTFVFLLMIAQGINFIYPLAIADTLNHIYHVFYQFFPLIFTISLAMSFARSYEIDPVSFTLLCTSLLLVSVLHHAQTHEALWQSHYFKILPIPLCYICAKVFSRLINQPLFRLIKSNHLSIGLKDKLNHLIPSIITFVLVFLLISVFESIGLAAIEWLNKKELLINDSGSLVQMAVLKFIFKLTWFLGINADHVYSFVGESYFDAYVENQMAYEKGLLVPHLITSHLSIYTDIGGSGSALSLLMAVLVYSQSDHGRHVAKLSSIPCAFNISEIIHFGLPVVFNPFLLIPFVLLPVVFLMTTYFFMSMDWVSANVVDIPWTTPPLLNAYLISGGQLSAVMLQVINLVIGFFVYAYFIKMSEQPYVDKEVAQEFGHKLNLNSKNIKAIQYRNQESLLASVALEKQINQILTEISQGELVLYYQPIISTATKKVSKVEALIRLKNTDENIITPEFIEVLSQAGLSSDIDKWVVKTVLRQSLTWSHQLNNVSISVNIAPSSLLDRTFVENLIAANQKMSHTLTIEILENQTVFEEKIINEHLNLLKEAGITILLDDFGSGYSALSMLSKLNIDGVKYDMNFTQNFNEPHGLTLFASCLDISTTLKHKTILEGIETAEQYQQAMASGVDMIQGFYVAQPLTPEELIDFMLKNTAQNN